MISGNRISKGERMKIVYLPEGRGAEPLQSKLICATESLKGTGDKTYLDLIRYSEVKVAQSCLTLCDPMD